MLFGENFGKDKGFRVWSSQLKVGEFLGAGLGSK
jgi:hypothetical protein